MSSYLYKAAEVCFYATPLGPAKLLYDLFAALYKRDKNSLPRLLTEVTVMIFFGKFGKDGYFYLQSSVKQMVKEAAKKAAKEAATKTGKEAAIKEVAKKITAGIIFYCKNQYGIDISQELVEQAVSEVILFIIGHEDE